MKCCSACGSTAVAKPVLVDVNDGSLIEELSAEPTCFDCHAPCDLTTVEKFAARDHEAEVADSHARDACGSR